MSFRIRVLKMAMDPRGGGPGRKAGAGHPAINEYGLDLAGQRIMIGGPLGFQRSIPFPGPNNTAVLRAVRRHRARVVCIGGAPLG